MSLLPVDDALSQILSGIARLEGETVDLIDAAGRILAEPILATRDQPPFTASAMDGYALASIDGIEGTTLELIGASQAGARFVGRLVPGQCVRIFTGAPLPEGADCVIMQEKVDADGDRIVLRAPVTPHQNVRAQGYDFTTGSQLLTSGTVLTPACLSLAASANAARCSVVRKPRVAIAATGDELVALGGRRGPDQIISSNSIGLKALLERWGAEVVDLGIIRDDREMLEVAFAKALTSGIDILVTTGGASVGEHDYVRDALIAAGVDIGFWRIAMRPGKPLMFGTKSETHVFGLPGNPVSAIATARVFIVPAIQAMLGTDRPLHRMLPLGGRLPANGARRHFIRAHLTSLANGQTAVSPISESDSGHLTSLAKADGFIDQPVGDRERDAGSLIRFLPL